jgi:hypothetical protein
MEYYVIMEDQTKGPYTISQLRSMWESGVLTSKTMHCKEGDTEWKPLGVLLSLMEQKPPITTEATGTQWKIALAVSGAAMVLGYFMFAGAEKDGAFLAVTGHVLLVLGCVGALVSAFGGWWENG